MPLLHSLARRRLQPEEMDQPGLDPARHRAALRGLARINAWSGSARILWPPLAALAREAGRPVRVLDVASGAGDVPIRLWKKAQRARLPLRIDGIDRSPVAVEHARRRAAQAGADVAFREGDALTGEWPGGYDAVISSLFLHHLKEEQAVAFLKGAAGAAGRLVLVNDLVRGLPGFLLAWAGTRLLSRCDVVHTDGVRSVEGAFTVAEARALAERAGLHGATVARRWPCRFLLTWRRP
ncbi:MAG TPA: methyltransferase domain-containing protein [Gemmataceae bacterium]|nr:methyltransferase domain-containing protein [Gemmataceae bacterium]